MIEVTVRRIVVSPEYQLFEKRVKLTGCKRLTPISAREALRLEFGTASGEVWSDDYGYRVYERSARRVTKG